MGVLAICVDGSFGGGNGRRGNFLVFVLKLIQLVVDTTLCQQLLMATNLAYLAFVHDDDFVCTLNCGKTMGDYDRSSPFNHAAECVTYTELGFRIDAGSGFIENQN